jgi:hypothetical protein
MRVLWRFFSAYSLEVRLGVKLNCFEARRLADVVQLLAHSGALITDLQPDRSHYHLGLAENYAEITFKVKNPKHRLQVLNALEREQFDYRLRI